MTERSDVLGAGIVGLATARLLLRARSGRFCTPASITPGVAPAAAASLAIGSWLADAARERFGLN